MSAKRKIDSARGLIRRIYDQLDDLEGELINMDMMLLREFMLMQYPKRAGDRGGKKGEK